MKRGERCATNISIGGKSHLYACPARNKTWGIAPGLLPWLFSAEIVEIHRRRRWRPFRQELSTPGDQEVFCLDFPRSAWEISGRPAIESLVNLTHSVWGFPEAIKWG